MQPVLKYLTSLICHFLRYAAKHLKYRRYATLTVNNSTASAPNLKHFFVEVAMSLGLWVPLEKHYLTFGALGVELLTVKVT